MKLSQIEDAFASFARFAAKWLGASSVFVLSQLLVLAWFSFGPHSNWSNAFWLIGNTWMSFVSYVMMFIIQNTQNRDSRALHLKLDEIIRGNAEARDIFRKAEQLTDSEFKRLECQ